MGFAVEILIGEGPGKSAVGNQLDCVLLVCDKHQQRVGEEVGGINGLSWASDLNVANRLFKDILGGG